jgi:hypothetical protein
MTKVALDVVTGGCPRNRVERGTMIPISGKSGTMKSIISIHQSSLHKIRHASFLNGDLREKSFTCRK